MHRKESPDTREGGSIAALTNCPDMVPCAMFRRPGGMRLHALSLLDTPSGQALQFW